MPRDIPRASVYYPGVTTLDEARSGGLYRLIQRYRQLGREGYSVEHRRRWLADIYPDFRPDTLRRAIAELGEVSRQAATFERYGRHPAREDIRRASGMPREDPVTGGPVRYRYSVLVTAEYHTEDDWGEPQVKRIGEIVEVYSSRQLTPQQVAAMAMDTFLRNLPQGGTKRQSKWRDIESLDMSSINTSILGIARRT